MFIIKCPWCGERDQTEFTCHGEAHITRPEKPKDESEKSWGEYLFYRKNPKGDHLERWVHNHGCKKWFNVKRNTISDIIEATYKPFEKLRNGKSNGKDVEKP